MVIQFTTHGWWATVHGVVFGGSFIVSLILVLGSLTRLRGDELTPEGAAVRLRWLRRGVLLMVLVAWVAVVLGTWVVDPWFHARGALSPRNLLEARQSLEFWNGIMMEWKERISWVAAIVATAAGFIAVYQGEQLLRDGAARRMLLALFGLAFAAASVSGGIGLLLAKLVPVR